ncbi:MAG: signal peptidase II [Oscillospiraceae bacterium]|nr:signal peptidase II [Oscillospiraceae bacterium]
MLYAIFGVLVIILDQWVKYWTAGNLVYGGEARPLIPGIVNLLNVHNDGAAFSFLSGANAGKIFVILAVVFTILVIIGLATNFISGKLARWCAVFVAAGGIGNAIDRALYGYVQDMFQFDFAKSFPVFNVADIFICVFCILFIICIIFGGRKEKGEEAYDEEYDEEEDAVRSKRGRKAKKAAEEEFEEEPAPRKASRRKAAAEEYEEEEPAPRKTAKQKAAEEEYEEEVPARRQRPAAKTEPEPVYEDEASPKSRNKSNATPRTTRKERQSKYDDQFEQYKANRDARQRNAEYSGVSSSAPAFAASIPAYDSSDPFAEWEKANAEISARKAAEADSAVKSAVSAAPAEPRRAASARESVPASAPASAPARREPAPAPKPTPAPAAKAEPAPAAPAAPRKSSDEEFSLDDILAEFK